MQRVEWLKRGLFYGVVEWLCGVHRQRAVVDYERTAVRVMYSPPAGGGV